MVERNPDMADQLKTLVERFHGTVADQRSRPRPGDARHSTGLGRARHRRRAERGIHKRFIVTGWANRSTSIPTATEDVCRSAGLAPLAGSHTMGQYRRPAARRATCRTAIKGEVLDPGYRSGHHAIYYASQGYSATGIDSSPSQSERAKENAARRRGAANFQVGDAMTRLEGFETVSTQSSIAPSITFFYGAQEVVCAAICAARPSPERGSTCSSTARNQRLRRAAVAIR